MNIEAAPFVDFVLVFYARIWDNTFLDTFYLLKNKQSF